MTEKGERMNKVTGGPAFPSKRRVVRDGYITPEFEPVNGMTLRDYFAAKAMAAKFVGGTKEFVAQWAYEMADAMLKERGEE
jgi:hypothetical protein